MASRPKTRARLQGALASRKDKRTSYPLPATHQEAPRNDFWGLFLAFRHKRASSSVNALRTALRPSRSPLALQLLAGLPHLLRLGGQCAKLLADALHLALDDPVSRAGVLLDPPSHVLPDGEGGSVGRCCRAPGWTRRACSERACARPRLPCTSLCVPCRNRLA